MDNYKKLTIDEIHRGLREKKFSAKELAAEALKVSEAENEKYGAFLHFSPERAMAAAEKVDNQIAAGEKLSELAGVPVAVKDVIMTEGQRTTCASRTLMATIGARPNSTSRSAKNSGASKSCRVDGVMAIGVPFLSMRVSPLTSTEEIGVKIGIACPKTRVGNVSPVADRASSSNALQCSNAATVFPVLLRK